VREGCVPKTFDILAVALSCLLVVSCGDSTGPESGEFSVTIGGDTSFTVEGEAVFGLSAAGVPDHWVIFLKRDVFGGPDFDAVAIGRHGSATPIGVGTHTIADASAETTGPEDIDAVFVLRRTVEETEGLYGSVSGSLTITSSSEDQLLGEFNFSAKSVYADGAFAGITDLTLQGSFTAVRGNVPSIGS
jgi:hypothetical protein